ncbi:winged helix-turn-helix transcriptional regulator [Mycobacterium koreense]|uniref:MarR family transcriptional regulator n=2 Tax=Mycolicibacillus koreensis TaxID=1069220 RepID=A0A7I7SFG7_9MYCO|nr:MarR family winged helix-turn-helix transcriptional regulator [Mycolicibacillus koreensis]MCV7248544.1 winged helix-turn-helix transcriptional regulator [Mycolicibacillus koreensis]OSC32736.1 MarR family transcriptional regulator [Mycolicibacillus koreensis]BBY55503.1 MarR family transcriptional regulator [Mycolicibacillus koreensis]
MPDRKRLSVEQQQAWRSFIETEHRLERHLSQHLQREFGLSAADFEVLVNLSEAPGDRMRMFALGEATQWEKSRLSHHLSRMERRGLVRRDSGDRRYPDIVLTDTGRAAITAAAPANAERVRTLFVEALGPERLALIRDACDDVAAALARHQDGDCTLSTPE